jgi:ABC-type multidrug transport system permease subunit
VFIRERANGLYSPGPYVLANTIAGFPFLFACTFLFSVIRLVEVSFVYGLSHHRLSHSYWAIGLHPGATAFFRFTLFLFLGVMAAESQSILVAAVIPIFVAALALASFLNGFWMVRAHQ